MSIIPTTRWLGLFLPFLLASTAGAAPGRFVSPYSPLSRPLAATALMSTQVTNKKNQLANRGFLDAQQYLDIRAGTLEIVKRYPPNQNFYITLGRSPTAIGAFLDNLSEHEGDLHANLPASNLRAGFVEGFEEAWFSHLEKFIPAHALTSNQRLVLIDRSTTGATLVKVKGIIESFLAKKGINKKVEVLAFARAARAVPIPFVDVTPYAELTKMNAGTYDGLAKYPWFYVGESEPSTLQRSPIYDQFKQSLLERMTRDPELDTALASANTAKAK